MKINPSQQSFDEIGQIFKHVAAQKSSAGHLYIVIDSKTGLVGTTHDKKFASTITEVSKFVQELAKTMKSDDGLKINGKTLRELNESFKTISDAYLNKNRNLFERILHLFSSKFKGIEQAKTSLKHITFNEEEKPKEYGTYLRKNPEGPGFKNVSYTYEKYAKQSLMEAKKADSEKGITRLDKLKVDEDLNEQKITEAFQYETRNFLRPSSAPGLHILKSFQDVLEELSTQVINGEITANEATDQFKSIVLTRIKETNQETLEVDRELFRDLMGVRLERDKESAAPSIPLSDPEVQKFIKEYKDGTWVEQKDQDGQVINPRKLTYSNIDPQDLDQMVNKSKNVLERGDFQEILLRFFRQFQKR